MLTCSTDLNGAEALDKLTALSSLVSTLVQKDKLKGRKRKFVLTDSDKEEDAELDVDPLIKLAKALLQLLLLQLFLLVVLMKLIFHLVPLFLLMSLPGGSDFLTVLTLLGPSTLVVVLHLNLLHHMLEMPEREKGVAVDEPTPTQDKTFKQLEEEN
ncbi:hypothetical protein Tco_0920631 [Tanacetum coccineum]